MVIFLIVLLCVILLCLFFWNGNHHPCLISRDCRGYNIEVDSLETWKQKANNQKLKILGFSGWSIDGEGIVKCTDLNKSSNAAIIRIYGSPEYVLKEDILAGAMGYKIHENDCIISEALAYDLFGSTNIINEKVIFDGKRYSVTSVIKNNQSFICFSLNEGKVECVEILMESRIDADRTVNALLE